jgi:superfamily I DNA and/or RNA helicase
MNNVNDVNDVNNSKEGTGSVIHELKVSTVDAFQGSEMDIIIICISKNSGSSFLR